MRPKTETRGQILKHSEDFPKSCPSFSYVMELWIPKKYYRKFLSQFLEFFS